MAAALFSAVLSLFLFSHLPVANAGDAGRCYRIPVDSPEMARKAAPRLETWCYRKAEGLSGGLYIFNADLDRVRPELALLVAADGTITHGSLSQGELSVHRVNSELFNPFSVPLKEPTALEASPVPAYFQASSADDVLRSFLAYRGTVNAELSVFQSPAIAAASFRPWRGYWWPYKNRPLQRGPYARFDQFVTQRTGSNPGAVAWENANHVYKGVWWEGHCNGWAAAAVLRAEPRYARVDSVSGIEFSVSDQKALYTGVDYCVNSAFFGRRYRGARGDDPRDIAPALFHKTLSYYIGSLHKPVAIDYHANVVVDNHVISAYRFDMQPIGTNLYNVTATLSVHRYDGSIINVPGTAPQYTRVYRYTLQTNNAGVPISGTWKSANPDFLWVPLSPRGCGTNNQGLKLQWVNTIMALPGRAL